MRIDIEDCISNNLWDVKIRLNGMICNQCIMADEENGEVLVYDRLSYVKGMDYMPRKILYGDVCIMMGDRK